MEKEIKPLESLTVGAIVVITSMLVFVPVITILFKKILPFMIYPFVPSAILILVIGLSGIRNIKIAHKGVFLVFGKRYKGYLFSEGWHWILPFITALEEIDVRLTAKDIEAADAFTSDKVLIKVDTTIQYKISDPSLYLGLGEKVIEKGLEDLTKQVLRTVAIKKDLNEALAMQQELNDILKNVITPGKEISEELREKYNLSKELDKVTEKWGIDIENVLVADVQPPDEVAKDLAKKRSEIAQQEAEMVEIKNVANLIKILTGKESAGLDSIEAARIVQSERKKLKRKEIIISGANKSIERAAAIIAGGTEKEGGDE